MSRFVIEFFRGDRGRGLYFGDAVSLSQIISIVLVPLSLLMLWWLSRQPAPARDLAARPEGRVTLTLAIPEEQAGARLDAALAALLPQQSRSQIQRLIKDGKVQVAGVRPEKVKASLPVEAQQEVVVDVPAPTPAAAQPQALPLDIVYEDADIVVIDKAAGMVVHPAAGHADGTLVNALLHHVDDLSGVGGELRPGIVHRLDKGTSGLDGRRQARRRARGAVVAVRGARTSRRNTRRSCGACSRPGAASRSRSAATRTTGRRCRPRRGAPAPRCRGSPGRSRFPASAWSASASPPAARTRSGCT